MSVSSANDTASLRQMIYALLITITVGITTARIIGVENVYDSSRYRNYPERWPKTFPEPTPTFGSNDRSRWATVKALVEQGTFVIGQRRSVDTILFVSGGLIAPTTPFLNNSYIDEGILFREAYRSIDVVKHPNTGQFFSSKPPLFTTLVAAEYWVLYHGLGWSLDGERWPVVCTILLTFNVLPLVLMLFLLSRLIEEYGTTDWGRIFVMSTACFGTFLTTFAVTLNNHTPAAYCLFFAVYPLLRGRALQASPYRVGESLVSGFFAGLTLCLDLPAAAFTAAVGALFLWKQPRALVWFIPAAIVPVASLVLLNYLAIGEWSPAYAKFGGPWYEYPGSHWIKRKQVPLPPGIDFANEPKAIYAFHTLLGHHGLFSLTPVWLIAFAGMIATIINRSHDGKAGLPRWLGLGSLVVSVVVVAFYIWRTNNYGGYTAGPRWQFWLIPLYLLTMLPIADSWSNSSFWRRVGYLCLGVSVFSVCYAVWNPWRHPWILTLAEYLGWLKY